MLLIMVSWKNLAVVNNVEISIKIYMGTTKIIRSPLKLNGFALSVINANIRGPSCLNFLLTLQQKSG